MGVNVAAFPRELLESELFGYERGAFTGARSGGNPGKFEQADGGTLLLDEIGDMPLEMQAKLLRVLQERMLQRLGGTRTLPITARVMATTHRDFFHIHINHVTVCSGTVDGEELTQPHWRDTLMSGFVMHCHLPHHEDQGMMELMSIQP